MTLSTIAEIVRTHGRERPDRPALEVGDRTVTFGELDRRSNQVAAALAAAGVGAEDRVAFIDKNSPEWFEVTFATAKLGAVNVSVNWRLAPPEMAQIIDDAEGVGRDRRPRVRPAHREGRGRARRGCTTIVAIGDHDRWVELRGLDR